MKLKEIKTKTQIINHVWDWSWDRVRTSAMSEIEFQIRNRIRFEIQSPIRSHLYLQNWEQILDLNPVD